MTSTKEPRTIKGTVTRILVDPDTWIAVAIVLAATTVAFTVPVSATYERPLAFVLGAFIMTFLHQWL